VKDALGSVQTVLLLGGTSEIGLATVKALACPRHAKVVLAGRSRPALEGAADAVRQSGASAVEVMDFDGRRTDSHPAFVDDAFARLGDVDVVVLAFGVLGDQEAGEKDVNAALDVMSTNYLGAASVALLVAQKLRAQGHGTLVVLSTVAAERARRSNFIYGSSKAGLDAFAQGLGHALVGSGAGVLVVRPGFVHTKMTTGMKPMPLSTDADTVAAATVRALARGDEVVWVPSTLRWPMLLLRWLPRSIFRRLPI
jgi:decaprenylphospho-beta-D-erythro-pentofuranosid-2-ulose 2-reductase